MFLTCPICFYFYYLGIGMAIAKIHSLILKLNCCSLDDPPEKFFEVTETDARILYRDLQKSV